jgi:hypothetical protein
MKMGTSVDVINKELKLQNQLKKFATVMEVMSMIVGIVVDLGVVQAVWMRLLVIIYPQL